MTFRIGIISDTHGLLRPEAERRLTGVDQIIHGGDIGHPDIIGALRKIAPVAAIRGNVDTGDWAGEYADTKLVRLAGRAIFVLHDLKTLQIDPVALGIDVVVSGHSHVPKIDTGRRGALLESGKRRQAAFQAADHACDARDHARLPATGDPRPRTRLNPSRGPGGTSTKGATREGRTRIGARNRH